MIIHIEDRDGLVLIRPELPILDIETARQFRRASEGLPLYRGLRYKAMAASLLAPGLSRLPEDLPLSRFLKSRWGQ